ncbi:cellulose-binding domain-containing protein [Micromonospora sp. M12]
MTYRNQSEWQSGFVARVTVHNAGAAPIDGWIVTFNYPGDQQVTSGWNATISQTGATVTARNVGWNRVLAPDGSATFGVQGRWSASDAAPTGFSLNGAPAPSAEHGPAVADCVPAPPTITRLGSSFRICRRPLTSGPPTVAAAKHGPRRGEAPK